LEYVERPGAFSCLPGARLPPDVRTCRSACHYERESATLGAAIFSVHLEVEGIQQSNCDAIVSVRELIDSHDLRDVLPIESSGSGRVRIGHKKTHPFEIVVAYCAEIEPVATDVQRLRYFAHCFRSRDRWSHANGMPHSEPGLTTFFQARSLNRSMFNRTW